MSADVEERIWLPHLLFDLAEAFGLAAALRFASAYGGRRLAVPKEVHEEHPIARDFGLPVLAWLVARGPGERILVPLGPQSSYTHRIGEIRRLLREGEDPATITRAVGCHVRSVYYHRRALRERDADDRQGTLDLDR